VTKKKKTFYDIRHQVDEAGHLLDDTDLTDSAKPMGHSGWKADEVVFTDRNHFDAECILKKKDKLSISVAT
jgi:hypothetical protein